MQSSIAIAMGPVLAVLLFANAGGATSVSGGRILCGGLLGLSHRPDRLEFVPLPLHGDHPGHTGSERLLRLKGGENFLDRLDRTVTNYVFG